MSKLPAGWAACSLADIGHIVTGKTPSTKESSFYGGSIPFIRPGDLNHSGPIVTTETFLTNAGAAEIPNLPPQSIVVTCIGNLGKVGLTTTTSATNQQINALIPETGIDPNFVFHYCKTLRPWLEAQSSATTISIVKKSIFSKAPIQLPPAAEQTRIAAKLDELLAQVDTLKARTDGIPALLKRFRQSVLAAAVSGKLTEEWRTKKASEGTTSPNKGWKTIRIDQASADEKYSLAIGPFGSNLKVSDYRDNGKPLVFVREIRAECFGDEKTKFITPEKFDDLNAHQISAGDILVTKMGAPPGDVAIYPANAPDAVITADCIKLRVNESIILREYAYFQMKSNFFRQKVQEISAGVAQQKVSLGNLRAITLLAPSLEEQREIVRHVGELLALADQLEARVKAAQPRIDDLTQSILAKAFRGELVPQDPNDEPASVLLERIKTQRATAPGTKRGRQAATSG